MDQVTIDSSYFSRRAAEERDAAQRARDPRARQTHLDLAERYAQAVLSSGRQAANDPVPEPHAVAPLLQPEFRILP